MSSTTAKEKDEEKISIEKQLEAIDKEFEVKLEEIGAGLPEELKLKPLDYTPKSDAEIKTEAQSHLQAYYNDGVNNIVQGAEDSKKELEANKTTAASAKDEKTAYIETVYDTAKENASNDILKRGLARSSIAVNTAGGYEQKKADEILQVSKKFSDEIQSLDNEILSLETKREAALRDFDITYAAKLAMKISDLSTERDEKAAEALKYNNSIKEKEADYSIERLKTVSELTGESIENLQKQIDLYTDSAAKLEEAKAAAKYDVLLAELNALSKKAALNELENNPIYRLNLTDAVYEKIYLATVFRKS